MEAFLREPSTFDMNNSHFGTTNEDGVDDGNSGIRKLSAAMLERAWLDLKHYGPAQRKDAYRWFTRKSYGPLLPYSFEWVTQVLGLEGMRDAIITHAGIRFWVLSPAEKELSESERLPSF